MGNDTSKTLKEAKAARPPTTAVISAPQKFTKHVLVLYKPWSERTTEIMGYFYDAFNQIKPTGLVEISSENTVDLSKHNAEYVRNRTSQWLMMSEHNVVLLCIAADQAEHLPPEAFIDKSGKLPSKLFTMVFGTEIPSMWPECYSLGIADLEKIERANDFLSDGLEVLGAAIRGVPE